MPPRLRKLALTAHVTASVGRLGAVASFLALAIVTELARLLGTTGGTMRHTFVGAGHAPQLTHPEQYAQTVRAFLTAPGTGRLATLADASREDATARPGATGTSGTATVRTV
jgi:hypothetical protein